MLQKFEKLISFYCLKGYFGKGKGFFKREKKKKNEVAIYCVPTLPLTDLEQKFTKVQLVGGFL